MSEDKLAKTEVAKETQTTSKGSSKNNASKKQQTKETKLKNGLTIVYH